jgi:hypothetical protein
MAGPRNALAFQGTEAAVALENSASFRSVADALTVEAWIKPEILAENAGIFLADRRYGLQLTSDGRLKANLMIRENWNQGISEGAVSAGAWHHVALTYDGDQMRFYIDGIPAGEADTAGGPIDAWDAEPLFMGEGFRGAMDQVRVWNSARTTTQLQNDMCAALNGDELGLAACYRFDQHPAADQTVLHDQTLNANHGRLTGIDPETAWVASSAFTTWIGSSGSEWAEPAHWSRNAAPEETDNLGIVDYSHAVGYPNGHAPRITGIPIVNHLVLASGAQVLLNSDMGIHGNLILNSDLDLNGRTIVLGDSALLAEAHGRLFGSLGTGAITTTRPLNAVDSQNVAGLGAEITTEANLEETTITRGHSAIAHCGHLGLSIYRYYVIDPRGSGNRLDATLRFHYAQEELNGIPETDLLPFRWNEEMGRWECRDVESRITRNPEENWVQLTGIEAFSKWTLGVKWPHSFVGVVSFTARGREDSVLLGWETAFEKDMAGFHVWRRPASGGAAQRINERLIPNEGGPGFGAVYAFEDQTALPGRNHVYELEAVDLAGFTETFGPVQAWAGMVNLTVNGADERITLSPEDPVRVRVEGQSNTARRIRVECWIAADTPFGWYSSSGGAWIPGIYPAGVFVLPDMPAMEVLNQPLPSGDYTFVAVLDEQINDRPDMRWVDEVEVRIR